MDSDNNQVVLVTEKGEIQHTYRGQNGMDLGAMVCQSHSIYVTDRGNHRVDELGVDGRHVRQLISQQDVPWPRSVCVDDTGRLYVTHGEYEGKQEMWVIDSRVTSTDTQASLGDRILLQQTNMKLSVTWCN